MTDKKRTNVTRSLILVLAIFGVVSWLSDGFSETSFADARSGSGLSTLDGREAVEHLKGQGLYSSLQDAVKAVNAGDPDPQTKITASDNPVHFGFSVAVSGNTAVVGAPSVFSTSTPGAAYVYVRGGTTWTLQQRLTSGFSGDDGFGWSVDIEGDTIVIGSPDDPARASGQWNGAAFVFVRSGTTWTEQARLSGPNTGIQGRLGVKVAMSGETVAVVGSRFPTGVSSVYVYQRGGATWSQQQELTVSGPGSSLEFGRSLAISGNIIAVGDPLGTGSVKFWVREGTSWNLQNGLTTGDNVLRYGSEIALNGNTLAVKASNNPSQFQPSFVYLYDTNTNGSSWLFRQKLIPPDGDGFEEYFGDALALEGDSLVVGDPQENINTPSGNGFVYEYRRRGNTWSRERRLAASDGSFADAFGVSVAVSGGTIFAGAWYDDIGANMNQGSAYVFECLRNENQQVVASDGEAGDWFGYSIAASGNTVVVGAKQEEAPGGSPSQGAAYVFTLNGGGWALQQKIKSDPPLGGAEFGHSVDIDGDTIVVGAWTETQPTADTQGAAYVFVRSGTTWSQQAKLLSNDGAFNDRFGNAVAIRGNTIVVGAFGDDVGANGNQGSAYIFTRSSTTWSQQAKLTAGDGAAQDEFGQAVDIDGDTVLVGAYRKASFKGDAYVFTRSGTAWTQQQKLSAMDGQGGDEFGYAVSLRGDTAAIGAWRDDEDVNQDLGSVYIFNRSGPTWTQSVKLLPNFFAFASFGSAVALDGDNLVIGQRGQLNRAYVYKRSGSAWNYSEDLLPTGTGVFQFGESVSISGETVAAGAFGSTVGGNSTRGAAWVYYANCSSAPVGTATAPINRRRCKPPAPATLGTVSDAQQTAGALTVTAQSVPQDLVLTNLANNNGTITATVGAGCALVQTGPQTIVLQVSDGAFGVSTFNVTVNVIEQKPADFDGDGKSDVGVWRPSDKNWWVMRSSDNAVSVTNFGLAGDRIVPGDYDGDGKTDIAVFRPSIGAWFRFNSSDGTFSVSAWGLGTDIPTPGEFDGDGRFDLAVFRPSNGTWYVLKSSDGGFIINNFGLSGDLPVPGDYDGDGRTDLAVFRPSNSVWYLLQSTAGFGAAQFGVSTDKPVQGDYDGDSKTDIAVYRPSNGTWYLLQSVAGTTAVQWGNSQDTPAAGDYDGDGKADLGVFRPSQGVWYVQKSAGGNLITTFGTTGDVPIESAYFPQ